MDSIDGANALKLDEKFEINEDDQNLSIENFDPSIIKEAEGNIPTGVSMENASYIESSVTENSLNNTHFENNLNEEKQEHTPKLFSDSRDDISLSETDFNDDSEIGSEELFNQENSEEEDFEIPAFLRKQKF